MRGTVYTKVSADDDLVISNLHKRFEAYGASRDDVAAVLRDTRYQSNRAVKKLRERYPESTTPLGEHASRLQSPHAGHATETEAGGGPEVVQIFSNSAGRLVDATVVKRESGRVSVTYRVGDMERTKTVREEDVVTVSRAEERQHDDHDASSSDDDDGRGGGSSKGGASSGGSGGGDGADATDEDDDEDDHPFVDAPDTPSHTPEWQQSPRQQISTRGGSASTPAGHLRMRLDAEASMGLTAGVIGIMACSILLTPAAEVDADAESVDQQPGRWQVVFVAAMSLSAALCVFTAAVCGAVYREGLRILSVGNMKLFHVWWKMAAVRRGRLACRVAHGAAVPIFLVGLVLHLHDKLSGDSTALPVAVATMFGVAWATASAISANVEGHHEQRSARS